MKYCGCDFESEIVSNYHSELMENNRANHLHDLLLNRKLSKQENAEFLVKYFNSLWCVVFRNLH